MAQSPPNKPDKAKKGGASAGGEKRQSDLKLIRMALSVFAITLLLSAGLVYMGNDTLEQKRAQLNVATQQRNEARQKLYRAREEEQEIREFLAQYQEFQQLGIVGEERRLDWIEALQGAYRKYKLYPIDYDFSPQQAVPLDASINPGGIELHATRLALKADLLHEGDFINLIGSLRQSAHGFMAAKECTLTRRATITGSAALVARLGGECTLHWLTLGERNPALAEGVPPTQ